jgi:hypothetical protein
MAAEPCAFQNQVFLEGQDCARGMVKNQAFACEVPEGVLEGAANVPYFLASFFSIQTAD